MVEKKEKKSKERLTDEERKIFAFRNRIARDSINTITALNTYCQEDFFWDRITPVRTYLQYFKSKGNGIGVIKKILAETNKRKLQEFNDKILEINKIIGKMKTRGVKTQGDIDRIKNLTEEIATLLK